MSSVRQKLGGLIVGVGLLGGCSTSVQRQLEGRWLGEQIENVSGTQLASATGWVRGTSFEFSGSNMTVTIPTEMPRTGPYEIERAEDKNLVIAVRTPNGALDRAMLSLDAADRLRWHVGNGSSILMRRVD